MAMCVLQILVLFHQISFSGFTADQWKNWKFFLTVCAHLTTVHQKIITPLTETFGDFLFSYSRDVVVILERGQPS